MSGTFDPYHRWLAIPPAEQPPNHYRLLGVKVFEDDVDVLESATDQRMAHLRTFQAGSHGKLSQKLLNEVAAASVCLLDPEKRAEYDEQLRAQLNPSKPKPLPRRKAPAKAAAAPAVARGQQDSGEFDGDSAVGAFVIDDSRTGSKLRGSTTRRPKISNQTLLVGGAAAGLLLIAIVLIAVIMSRSGEPVANNPQPTVPGESTEVPSGEIKPDGPHHKTPAGSIDLDKGLVAHYDFTDGPEDKLGKYGGELINNAVIRMDSTRGQVLDLDGNRSYLQMKPGAVDGNLPDGLTLAIWAKPTASRNWARLFGFGNGPGANNIAFAREANSDTLNFNVHSGGKVGAGLRAQNSIELDRWQHFTVTLEPLGMATIYVDGVQVAAGNVNATIQNVPRANCYLGQSNWDENGEFQGQLDDARIYHRILSPAEVQALAGASKSEPPPANFASDGLIAYYDFTSGADDKTGKYDGKLVGDAHVLVDPTRGSVLSLDGTGDRVEIPTIFSGPANVTLAAWIFPEGEGGVVVTLADAFAIRVSHQDARGFFHHGGRKHAWRELASRQDVIDTGWRHVAVTFDDEGDAQKFYLDGRVVACCKDNRSIRYNGRNTIIGRHGTKSANPFQGKIDDVRIYNRALAPNEIATLATAKEIPFDAATAIASNVTNPPATNPADADSTEPPASSPEPTEVAATTPPVSVTPPPDTSHLSTPTPEPARIDNRWPAPSKAEQAEVVALISEAFGLQKVAGGAPKAIRDTASQLIEEGKISDDAPAAQYVMFLKASELTAKTGDLDAAFGASEELTKRFRIDPIEMRVHLTQAAVKANIPPESREQVLLVGLQVVDEAVAADQYEAAEKMTSSLLSLAGRISDRSYAKQVADRRKVIAAKRKAYAKVQGALEALKINPDDPEANTTLGTHLCLRKGEWGEGLARLAKGSDPNLKKAAQLERSNPSDAMKQLEIADAWHDSSEGLSEDVKLACLDRAKTWYERCMPKLPGLHKIKAQRRIEKIAAAGTGVSPSNSEPVGPSLPSKGLLVATADYRCEIAVNGTIVANTNYATPARVPRTFNPGDTIIARVRRRTGQRAFACAIKLEGHPMIVTGARNSGWMSYRPASSHQWYMGGGQVVGPAVPTQGASPQVISQIAGTQCGGIWSSQEDDPASSFSYAYLILQFPGTPPATSTPPGSIAVRPPTRPPSATPSTPIVDPPSQPGSATNPASPAPASSDTLTRGLLAHWKLDEGSGTGAADSSGNGYNGTLRGAARWCEGRIGKAVEFDGSSASIGCGNPAALSFTGDITMSAWIKLPVSGSHKGEMANILAHGHSQGNRSARELVLRIRKSKHSSALEYNANSWNGSDHGVVREIPSSDRGRWIHLAGTYGDGSWRLYRDGVLVASARDSTGAIPVGADWAIGSRGNGQERFFRGAIDDVRIYNRALTADEVKILAKGT